MSSNAENRRQALKKIGLALAAATAGDATGLAAEQPPQPVRPARPGVATRELKIPASVTLAPKTSGEYDIFVAHEGSDASILIVPSSDSSAVTAAKSSLSNVSPAKASVVNGVVHVGLGAAGASRSSVAQHGAINFRGAAVSNKTLISR